MITTPRSTVIGVFPDHDAANQAIDDLRRTRFGYERIRLVERGTGNFFDTLKGMFTGQAHVASSDSDTLIKMGMPEHDARYYQGELDASHVLLLMNADERPEEAFNIMRQNGAFDISSRFRMDPASSASEVRPSNGHAANAPTPAATSFNAPAAYEPAAPTTATPYGSTYSSGSYEPATPAAATPYGSTYSSGSYEPATPAAASDAPAHDESIDEPPAPNSDEQQYETQDGEPQTAPNLTVPPAPLATPRESQESLT